MTHHSPLILVFWSYFLAHFTFQAIWDDSSFKKKIDEYFFGQHNINRHFSLARFYFLVEGQHIQQMWTCASDSFCQSWDWLLQKWGRCLQMRRKLFGAMLSGLWENSSMGSCGRWLLCAVVVKMYFMKANLGILDNGDMIWPIVLTGESSYHRGPPILVRP